MLGDAALLCSALGCSGFGLSPSSSVVQSRQFHQEGGSPAFKTLSFLLAYIYQKTNLNLWEFS